MASAIELLNARAGMGGKNKAKKAKAAKAPAKKKSAKKKSA
jgi:hypothetical protein